ncbi:MAG: hypothetical protein P1P89_17350 [Desulfobacterales bacterium]|nr:hypothetical protein [Desulfobacterales bacterium]
MDDDKKVAAAIAAVNRYLETEASQDGHPILRNGGFTSRMNIWGVSGRQHQMQMRTLMQLRTFNK